MASATEAAKTKALSIKQDVDLMYQNSTARRYYLTLLEEMKPELVSRGIRIIVDEFIAVPDK